MSNLIDDYRTLTANVVKDPHLTRWFELLAITADFSTPMTRSPGFSSSSVDGPPARGGLAARSESGVAPLYDRRGWRALSSLGIGLFVIWAMFYFVPSERPKQRPSPATVHLLHRSSIGSDGMVRLVSIAQF